MEKGVNKHWTTQNEEHFKKLIASCKTFAERFMIINIRNTLKYDLNGKASKRENSKLLLQLVVATDQELEELARLQVAAERDNDPEAVPKRLMELKKRRDEIKEKGIKPSDLENQVNE